MGFMDKVKQAAGSAVKGALQMAATSYGIVDEGKYKGSKVCMNTANDTLVFILVAAVQGKHVIKDDIQCFDVRRNRDLFYITLYFNDGETSRIVCKPDENKGSALPDASARLAAHYKDIHHLVSHLAKHTRFANEETQKEVSVIAAYCSK